MGGTDDFLIGSKAHSVRWNPFLALFTGSRRAGQFIATREEPNTITLLSGHSILMTTSDLLLYSGHLHLPTLSEKLLVVDGN